MGLMTKITMGLGVVILVMTAGFYWYYQNTQNKLELLQANQARLELSVQMQRDTIERQRDFLELQQEYSRQLQRGLAEAETRPSELQQILNSHDLDALSIGRPGLMEQRINRGTERVLRELEEMTERWYNERR